MLLVMLSYGQLILHSSLEWEILDLNRPGQIEHSVARSFLSLQHFFEGSYVANAVVISLLELIWMK